MLKSENSNTETENILKRRENLRGKMIKEKDILANYSSTTVGFNAVVTFRIPLFLFLQKI